MTLSHELGSEWVSERASERMSAAERAIEANSAEQASEWAVRANVRADEQVAQYTNVPISRGSESQCTSFGSLNHIPWIKLLMSTQAS